MRRLCLAALLLTGRLALAQGTAVVVRDAGPGPIGRYLSALLQKPDTRVIIDDTVTLAGSGQYPAAVVVIGRRVNVTGVVRGDLVIVGGDLFLKPNGRIEGEGIAIGGGAYGSVLGTARGGLTSHRDFTFDTATTAGRIELSYREDYVSSSDGPITLPGVYGLGIPSYDRSNGVSLGLGARVAVGRLAVEPLVTYRSQIGKFDPSLTARMDLGRKLWLQGAGGRDTRTREDWINGRLINSLNSLISGHDERNWYRAKFAEARVHRMFETPTMTATWSIGGLLEDASPTRPGPAPTGGPWSLTDRRDSVDGMFRPNPQVLMSSIASVVAGAAYRWTAGDIKANLGVELEVPVSVSGDRSFQQATIDGRIAFPTFGLQTYRLELHGVLTTGDTAPSQRYSYLGGAGTLPTEELLSSGGDELLFIESRYDLPVTRIILPMGAGSPTLTFRHILGSTGIQTLPDFTQIVGLRVSVSLLRAQILMDTGTRKTQLSAGLSLNR